MKGSIKLNNDGISLEVKHNTYSPSKKQVFYLLGLDEDSRVFEHLIEHTEHEYCVIARLRGSGESDSPEQRYSAVEFANDIRFIFFNLKLNNPVIVMSGLTSVYCIKFLLETPVEVNGLIFLNNGASCIPLSEEWLSHFNKSSNSYLSTAAAKRLVKDSEFINYYPEIFKLETPIYLLRSETKTEDGGQYEVLDFKRFHPNITVKEMPNSGKYICDDDKLILSDTIKEIQGV